jgi:Zinc finger C-x8-C-x5-C-x3-H type (and similar)
MRTHAPVCQNFVRSGACAHGPACPRHHPYLFPGPPIVTRAAVATARSTRARNGAESPWLILDEAHGFFPEFPQRPGSEECPHFERTGDCRFGPRCAFNHPARLRVRRNFEGFPMRPGAEVRAPREKQPVHTVATGVPLSRNPLARVLAASFVSCPGPCVDPVVVDAYIQMAKLRCSMCWSVFSGR